MACDAAAFQADAWPTGRLPGGSFGRGPLFDRQRPNWSIGFFELVFDGLIAVVSGGWSFGLNLQVISDDFSVFAARLDGLKPAVEIDGSSDVAVTQESSDGLVVAWIVLQINSRRGMAELVHCDPQPGCFLNPVRDLDAEEVRVFGCAIVPGNSQSALAPRRTVGR